MELANSFFDWLITYMRYVLAISIYLSVCLSLNMRNHESQNSNNVVFNGDVDGEVKCSEVPTRVKTTIKPENSSRHTQVNLAERYLLSDAEQIFRC
jgi:hypothetical protein